MKYNIFRNKTSRFKQVKRFNPNFDNEETVLLKKLLTSVGKIFLILTLLIFGLQFFGPKVFSIFGFFSLDRFKKKDSTQFQTQTPFFTNTVKASKEKFIKISGAAEIDSSVKLFVNGPEVKETKTGSDGTFTFEGVELIEGGNLIFAKATSSGKTESQKSETLTIVFDTKKPEIQLISPVNGQKISGVDSRVNIKGKVNEESAVTINSHQSVVDSEGNFSSLISLKKGNNTILIMARDLAGNESSISANIEFEKR